MKIVIAGGTGFLGRPLSERLASDGNQVVVLGRHRPSALAGAIRFVNWPANSEAGAWQAEIDGADAVINLAGESIAGKRWSTERKAQILNSRVNATRALVGAVTHAVNPPAMFVSGSAVGYYGPLGDEIVAEAHAAGSDFLAQVCVQWEAEAARANSARTTVVCVRTGIVLERDGGALPEMLPPFWFGAGGPVGSGRQYWPWIHRDDWVGLVAWILRTPAASGAINATGPTPVTNADFAKTLGRTLHRPAFMPAPGFALRLLLGEMADALLLSGQRVVPARALQLGFGFHYTRLDDALAAIFRK